MIDAARIGNRILGLFCMDTREENDTLTMQLREHQSRFFSEGELLRIDAKEKSVDQLAEELQSHFVTASSMTDYRVAYRIAVFYDLRRALDEGSVNTIINFCDNIRERFSFCTVSSIDHFAYIGDSHRRFDKTEFQREVCPRIGCLQSILATQKLLLVGEIGDLNGNCWVPVFALLDLLRRADVTHPLLDLDSRYRVGSFRYADYDLNARREYESSLQPDLRQSICEQITLSSFQSTCERTWKELEGRAKAHISPDASLQPIHTKVELNAGLLHYFARRRARQPGSDYQRAVRESTCAITQTAKKMEDLTAHICKYSDEQANALFQNVSTEVLSQDDIRDYICNGMKESNINTEVPIWKESLTESIQSIQKYMEDCFSCALDKARASFFGAIYRAYISACNPQKRDDRSVHHEPLNLATEQEPRTLSEFCREAIVGGCMLSMLNSPCNEGDRRRVCVCYGNDREQNSIDEALNNPTDWMHRVETALYRVPNCTDDLSEKIIVIDIDVYDYQYTRQEQS